MQTISALIFPETSISQETAAQLLLFFNKVFYYQPTEIGGNSEEEHDALNSLYGEKGLCQGYPPFPLKDDLNRFNQTIKELYSNWAIYGDRAQQQSMTSFYTEKYQDKDESSIDSLVNILNKVQTSDKSSSFHNAKDLSELWKARIILKLAELFDSAENEIIQNLDNLTTSENKMLNSLLGHEDKGTDDIISDHKMAQVSPFGDETLKQRLRAWGQFYLSEQKKENPVPEYRILTITKKEAVESIFTAYTDISSKRPEMLFSLPIAAVCGPTINSSEPRSTFHKEAEHSLGYFNKFLLEKASEEKLLPIHENEKSHLEKEIETWSVLGKKHYLQFDEKKLSFYNLPGLSITQWFNRILHHKSSEDLLKATHKKSLMAVLD